jgi:exodeoxyribonuclease VII small subunit
MNNELTYDKAVKRLEEILALLEKNDVSLDESIKLFEEAQSLLHFATRSLKTQNKNY